MKIARLTLFVSFCSYIFFTSINAEANIVLKFQTTPYNILKSIENTVLPKSPQKINPQILEKLGNKITNPEKLNRKMLKANLRAKVIPSLSGFLGTYAGYISYSNENGILTFPIRHTPTSKIYLLIASELDLNFIRSNTLSCLTTDTNSAELYLYERKKDKNEALYWDVKKINITENQKVNDLTVAILAKPKNIFIAEGQFKTTENANLILPNNIYVINHDENAEKIMNFLDIQRYFEEIRIEKQKTSETYNQEIIVNP